MKEYKAAVTALTNSLKEYADSKYREEMMFLKLNSLFLYAEKQLRLINKRRDTRQHLMNIIRLWKNFLKANIQKMLKKYIRKQQNFLKLRIPTNIVNISINKYGLQKISGTRQQQLHVIWT